MRGGLAFLKPLVDAVRDYDGAIPSSAAKATLQRIASRVRRAEMASDAAAEFLRLAREGMRWRSKAEPYKEPLQETMLSLHCPNWVTDRIGSHYDRDSIPGLAAGSGDAGSAQAELVVGNGDDVGPLLRFVEGDSAKKKGGPFVRGLVARSAAARLSAATEAFRLFADTLSDAVKRGARQEHCRACIDAFANRRCGALSAELRPTAERCGQAIAKAVAAMKEAHNDTLAMLRFVDSRTDSLLDQHYRLERLCTAAWPMGQWAQLNTAAIKAGVKRLASRQASMLFWISPPGHDTVPRENGEMLRYVNPLLFEDMRYFPLTTGVSTDDPALLELERSASQTFLTTTAKVQWGLPCDCAGFTVEAVWIIAGLREFVEVAHGNSPLCYCPGPGGNTYETIWNTFNFGWSPVYRWRTLAGLRGKGAEDIVDVHVHHWDPISDDRIRWGAAPTGGDYHVMRTMYEFSHIPSNWAAPLNSDKYDEIWVPCAYVERAFIDSGVNASKIRIVPEPVDTETFNPDRVDPLPIPVEHYKRAIIQKRPDDELREAFKFCSVFKFEPRKGWHALMEAFFTSFTRSDKVSLYVVGFLWGPDLPKGARGSDDPEALRHIIELEAAKHGRIHRDEMAHVEVITSRMSDYDIARLYKACDAFVLPSHGEGWGLPVIQAMAMGLPTITVNGSGISAFTTNDTVLYANASERPVWDHARKLYALPEGSTWLEPDVADLSRLLKHVRQMPSEERQALGRRAMVHVRDGYSQRRIGRLIGERVVEIEKIVRRRWAMNGRPAGKPSATPSEDPPFEVTEAPGHRLRPQTIELPANSVRAETTSTPPAASTFAASTSHEVG